MEKRKFELAVGSLLHDTGKLLYRYNDSRNHSDSGYDFLKELTENNEILNCVRYHHAAKIKNAGIANDAVCYFTYIADNIAAFSDRRKNESGDSGFVKNISYESIFNILNSNKGKSAYIPAMLTKDDNVHYPSENEITYNESFYSEVLDTLKNAVRGIEETADYINSLVEISEACLSYIPSSTQTGELRDISLFDHVKLTAAIALCIYDYAKEKGITDLKKALFENAEKFYDEKAFVLYSADISGIQNFIYNISSESALKGLRSRSFYLEIILEHFVNTLIGRLELARCNVLYTGGGHTYLIVPNTEKTAQIIKESEKEINLWFIENFGADLYIAGGGTECSANSLRNVPKGSYRTVFSETSKKISKKKLCRYSAEELKMMNRGLRSDNERECTICCKSDKLSKWKDDKYICSTCSGLLKLSDSITDSKKNMYFSILECHGDTPSSDFVSLPFDCCMTADSEETLKQRMKTDKGYIRSYCKNSMYSGKRIASKLWVGDYCAEKDLSELVRKSNGIERLGVLRADIDNLGTAFVNGFPDEYTTISRTSEFSAKLSLFFKHDINSILRKPVFSVTGEKSIQRNITVIYSGGDDVFAVGTWDDVIGFAVDFNDCLKKFSEETLTISAGIGMFDEKYPLYAMAEETGKLEDFSKKNLNKNSVTLFDETGRYHWDELKNSVIGEKLKTLKEFLKGNEERGKSMLYKMLELIRVKENENRLNIARFAYLLARLAPTDKESADYSEKYARYKDFTGKLYRWINNEEDCRQLVTSIYLYVYSVRKKDNDNG